MPADDSTECTDESLMLRLREGDEAALGRLMERWETPLKSFLYRLLLDAGEAAEVAQEAFVKLFFQRARFRPEARFAPWLLTIAANLARNRRRWWRRHPTVSLDAPAADGESPLPAWEAIDSAAGPADRVLAAERAAEVRRAIAELSHELREIVVLAEFEERPHAEIAQILGCTAKAVEMRLYRAREKLRGKLGASRVL
ncbi:MAG TPA: sigma-70 family RNA polymerase sigma factor [Opitutaceae bacterium]|nr:sigma-70 family RNA polymerase sigma factor [Opitutaceae bacterium]